MGKVVEHNILIHNGLLTLNRPDLALKGRGSALRFTRNYTNRDSTPYTPLGQGWTHNNDITLTVLGYGDRTDVTANNIPVWVDNLKGGYFRTAQIPDRDPDLSLVLISGHGMFKKVNNDWIPQRGYHGTLTQTGTDSTDSFTYTDKTGTRYQFDYPTRPPKPAPPTHLSYGDTLITRIGLHPDLLVEPDNPGVWGYPQPTPVRFIEDRNGNRTVFTYEPYQDPFDRKRERITTITDAPGRTLAFTYTEISDSLGDRLTGITALSGGTDPITLTFTYSSEGILTTATRSDRTEQYTYHREQENGSFNLTTVTDSNNQTTEYLYEPNVPQSLAGWITNLNPEDIIGKVHYPDNTEISITYDTASANRRIIIDRRNSATTYQLNFYHNPLRIDKPENRTIHMTWTIDQGKDDNLMTSITDGLGGITRYDHDIKGNITKETDPNHNTTVTAWNQQYSVPLTRTDRNNHTTTYTYNSSGNLITQIGPENHTTTHTYTTTGERLTTTDPRTNTTAFTYNAQGNPATITGPEGSVTQYDHDIRGRLIVMTDPLNHTHTYTYDTLDRLTTATDPTGNRITATYDPEGNKLTETDKSGLRLTHTYDPLNRLLTTRNSYNATKIFTYDPNGNLTAETDWKGETSATAYDLLNRKTSITNRAGDTGSITYDLANNKTSTTDRENRTTRYAYDNLNRLTKTIDPLTNETTATYDNENNPLTITDRENRTTTFTYDNRDLKTGRTDALLNIRTWDYDQTGNLTAETDEAGRTTTYTYDKQNRRTATTDPLTHTTQYTYDLNGNITALTNARGHTTATTYDPLNRPVKVTDPDNFTTITQYDPNGNITQQTDGNGNTRTATYDLLNRKTGETDAENAVTLYGYDKNSNLIRTTDPLNTVTTTYDLLDRPTATIAAAGQPEEQRITNTYDKTGNLLTVTNGRNHTTTSEYDALNRLTSVTDALTNTTQYTYDKTGNLLTVTDPLTHTTTHTYDALNRRTATTDALTQTMTTTYDNVGNVKTETDKRGITATHTYDPLNRLTQTDKAGITIVQNEYDETGNLTAVTDANTNRLTTAYTKRNLASSTTYPDTTSITMTYDGVGNILTQTDETGQTVTTTYDKEDRILTATNPENETTAYAYDLRGNRIETTRPKGDKDLMTHDLLDRLKTVTDPLTATTTYEYDKTNNLIAQVDALNHRVEYGYDALNRRLSHTQIKSGGNLVTTYEYDNAGNRIALRDAKNQRITYTYDAINRETGRTYPNITTPYLTIQGITTAYDPNSNPVSITETKIGATDLTTITYDDFDRETGRTQRGSQITYTYDNNGNRTGVTSTAGTTTYAYNSRNRLTQATAGTETTDYTYTPDGKTDTITYPNSATANYTYDNADRTTGITNNKGDGTILSQYTYTYDNNSNRATQTELQNGTTETTAYTYDNANRMTVYAITAGSDTETTTYTLNAVGNRITEQVRANTTTTTNQTFTYDEINRLTRITDTLANQTIDYTYDNNGNTISKLDNIQATPESSLFSYDTRDQLIQVLTGDQGSELTQGRYDYDYQGFRIRHLDSERGDIHYLYDGRAVLEERNTDTDALVAHYRYADRLISLTTPTETNYYHFDGLGSTANLTDGTGQQKVGYRLDPWGTIRSQQGTTTNRQIFTGQEHDENTGLIYFGARYYDPATGLFITQDSYFGEPGTPPSLHRYLYAYSNPTVYVDPDGEAAVITATVGTAVVVTGGAAIHSWWNSDATKETRKNLSDSLNRAYQEAKEKITEAEIIAKVAWQMITTPLPYYLPGYNDASEDIPQITTETYPITQIDKRPLITVDQSDESGRFVLPGQEIAERDPKENIIIDPITNPLPNVMYSEGSEGKDSSKDVTGIAKNSKWVKSIQGVEGSGLRDHFRTHGEQVGARTAREYDASARQTIQNGRRFTYRDRSSGEKRVGYYDAETGLFTATSQTRNTPAITTHFPETWANLRKLPGFSAK